MTPRVSRALRELADAIDEMQSGKPKKARKRGPNPLTAEERGRVVDPAIERQVEARLVANGWRTR